MMDCVTYMKLSEITFNHAFEDELYQKPQKYKTPMFEIIGNFGGLPIYRTPNMTDYRLNWSVNYR